MYKNFVAFAIAMAALPLFAQQADSSRGRALAYEEALIMVMDNNGQIKADRYAEEALVKAKKAAAGLRSPQISLGANYTFMSDKIGIDMNGLKEPVGGLLSGLGIQLPPTIAGPIMSADWGYTLQERDFAIVGATVKAPIYTGGKINAANRAAKIRIEEGRQKSAANKNSLQTELVERYFGLSLAMHVVDVRRQVVEGMQKHLDDAIKLEQNGMIARVERLYAEMKLSEAKAELKKAQSQASTIAAALAGTIGSEENVIPVSSMFVLSQLEGVDYYQALASQNSPILKQVDMKKSLAQEAVKAERANFIPQVAAMGGINIYDYKLTNLAPRWVVGAGVSFKLFNGLTREYNFAAAKTTVKQVEALQGKINDDINTLIEKLYNQLTTVSEQIEANDATIAFAKEYLRIKEKAFLEGTAPSSDVVDARLNLAAAEIARLQCAYNFDLQLAQLLEACGASDKFIEYRSKSSYKAIN